MYAEKSLRYHRSDGRRLRSAGIQRHYFRVWTDRNGKNVYNVSTFASAFTLHNIHQTRECVPLHLSHYREGFNREGGIEARGIIPRAIEQIFGHIQKYASSRMRFLVRASYLQIYNEQVRYSDIICNPELNCWLLRIACSCEHFLFYYIFVAVVQISLLTYFITIHACEHTYRSPTC